MSQRNIRVIEEPQYEPVTLNEARLWCRDPAEEDNAMLLLLIRSAREQAEEITGRAFVSRRLELRLDDFPTGGGVIELPYPPLRSVQSITYATDDGDVVIGGSPDAFIIDTGSIPGRIMALEGSSWPATTGNPGAVRIAFTCGYATTQELPASLRIWMQSRISTLFEQREAIMMGTNMVPIPRDFVDGLLDGLRVRMMFG